MSDPRWRETRPSRPYGGESGGRPRGRVPGPPPTAGRVPGRPPGAAPPRILPGATGAPRREVGRGIFPVPVLSYLVGALISGFVFNRSGTSKTALAIGAAQWVANGFFAMALATVLAVAIVAVRWRLWRRSRPPAREVRRSPANWEAGEAWDDADPRSAGRRRPGPRSGTGPYNFSS